MGLQPGCAALQGVCAALQGVARLARLETRLEPTDVVEVLGHVRRQHGADDRLARLLELARIETGKDGAVWP